MNCKNSLVNEELEEECVYSMDMGKRVRGTDLEQNVHQLYKSLVVISVGGCSTSLCGKLPE